MKKKSIPSRLEFRKATDLDIETIHTLAEIIWRDHYPSVISMEQIDYMLAEKYSIASIAKSLEMGEKYFLAILNGEAIGYGSFVETDSNYFIQKLYVKVDEHRKGIGAQLLEFMLQNMRCGADVRLQVNRQNVKAINFYFRNGFVIEKSADFPIGNGFFMNDFVMIKRKSNSQ